MTTHQQSPQPTLFQPDTVVNPTTYASLRRPTPTVMVHAHHAHTTLRAMLAPVRPLDLARRAHRVLHEMLAAHDHLVPFVQIDIRHADVLKMTLVVHDVARVRGAQIDPQCQHDQRQTEEELRCQCRDGGAGEQELPHYNDAQKPQKWNEREGQVMIDHILHLVQNAVEQKAIQERLHALQSFPLHAGGVRQ